jgi:hypothetical protein
MTTLRVPATAIQNEHNWQPALLPNCSILHIPDPVFCLHLQMPTLRERVLAKLQKSSNPKGSSVTALAKSLNEPIALVRFALEQLRDQGIAVRRGGWWSIARYSRAGAA